jgi:N-acetyl-anhydromuramoyl-L-alanine amidase
MTSLSESGWHASAQLIPSPNFDARPLGQQPDMIVIHAISLPPGQFRGDGVRQLFLNQLDPDEDPYYREIFRLKVSSHFFIRRTGALIQFVACNDRAWHAGQSTWKGRERCNDFSIGIELEGDDFLSFEEVQYVALSDLIQILRNTYPIAHIVGHSDIAPGRKTDPGPCFDWSRIPVLD